MATRTSATTNEVAAQRSPSWADRTVRWNHAGGRADGIALGSYNHGFCDEDWRRVEPSAEVTNALQILATSSVDETAHALGLSSRYLRRLLLEHTGLGPKEHQRIRRLRRFLDDDMRLADAAVAAGYADQSHLSREVSRLCGLPPAALRAETPTSAPTPMPPG